MTAKSAGSDPRTWVSPWPSTAYQKPIKSAEVLYRNAVVAMDTNGEWVEATATAADVVYGFLRLADADSITGNGTIEAIVDTGCKLLVGSGLAQSDEGSTVYTIDDQTFDLSSSTGTRPPMGKLMKVVSSTAGYVAIDPIFNETAAAVDIAVAGMTVSKKTVTVGHADLTEPNDNTPQAISIGTALPANARIVGVDIHDLTVFTGGSTSAVTVDIGTAGDIDALIDGADLQTTAVDGGPATMPQGIRPNKFFAAGGQLIATFLTDSGHDLEDLTAGSVIIDVLYVVKA